MRATETAMAPGAAKRILTYLGHMFPPAVMVPSGAANFLAIFWTLEALAEEAPLRVGWRAVAGAASVILFALLLRVYDELKDVETDLRLGRAGDPRYKDRPIVTGAVKVEDIVALRWIATAALVALNAPLGFPLPLAAFAAAFALTWLSFKWYFCPAISKSLLLAFATHNPLSLVISAYVVAVYVREAGAGGLTRWTVPLVVALWAPVAAWETARKVRVPADETDYQTYSKVLGWKRAALVPAVFLVVSVGILVPLARAAGLGWAFPGAALAAGALGVAACVRLRVAPTSGRANLRPFMELYLVVVNVGLAVALAVRYGVAWAR